MKLNNEEKAIKKTLVFILEANCLSDYEIYLDNLIAKQGIENVFNKLYKLFCSHGNIIAKNNKIIEIIQKYSKN